MLGYKIIKLTCGDIIIGNVTGITNTMVPGYTGRKMEKPWEYTRVQGGYTVVPYQGLLYGEGYEVKHMEINSDQIVYEKKLDSVPSLKDAYFERSMSEAGIVV